MRKAISVVLVAALCCGLVVGCGGGKKNNSEQSKEKTSDFDAATNQKMDVQGYSYEIPQNWEEKNSKDNLTYYYPEDAMLMVTHQDTGGISITNADFQKEYSKNVASGLSDYELIDSSETVVAGKVAYREKTVFSIEKQLYDGTFITFDYNGGIVSFMFGVSQSSNKDYSDDFNAVIKSVVENTPSSDATQTKEVDENSSGEVNSINLDADIGTLVYNRHEIGTNYEGEPLVKIYFDYTNTSNENSNSMLDFYLKVFQNGIEKDFDSPEPYGDESKNLTTDVQPGVGLPVCFSYKLDDTTSDVTLEVRATSDWNEENKQIMILKLQ